ncbi:MAG TPA: fumarylacetoacetate hydrolase family protein [Dinghuibacter sp.]|jgi:2-dehydro-3-deoxy-D-arabinonate dehydratase|uniref:fumarylacetoacetate hydrolase family protein n=1 Tax=Dinghuibacter sp. TaxID=2024697 RepID=UPI002CF9829D|nr:fumarylacetoacetate hydrolase family protein [Dinghuibacter sp.]HTJ11906.1 fumarylacetoacetate hydrolase family protein [Dinghuibacter sp.]
MRIFKTADAILLEHEGACYVSKEKDWDRYINRDELYASLINEIKDLTAVGSTRWMEGQPIVAPIGSQEVWAAGVTYLRSKAARMEESKDSGGSVFYDKVYDAERPELFFKATAQRVSGHGNFVRIRKDSTWNVPEPELVLVISSSGKIIGYTIGNDMSSRSIEGENPLYLPQAKVYERCAGLGPGILVTPGPIAPTTEIYMSIGRARERVFEGRITIDKMKRKHEELVEFLYRECAFPHGAYLMTGTCIVPDNSFTLQRHDKISIRIDGIGVLVNMVE